MPKFKVGDEVILIVYPDTSPESHRFGTVTEGVTNKYDHYYKVTRLDGITVTMDENELALRTKLVIVNYSEAFWNDGRKASIEFAVADLIVAGKFTSGEPIVATNGNLHNVANMIVHTVLRVFRPDLFVDHVKLPVGKYGTVEAFAAKLHPGEPWFGVRAQDQTAPGAVEMYVGGALVEYERAGRKVDEKWVNELYELRDSINTWQTQNPDKVKLPD